MFNVTNQYLAIVCCVDACGNITEGDGFNYAIEEDAVFEEKEEALVWIKKQLAYYYDAYEDSEYEGYLLAFDSRVFMQKKVVYEVENC